LCVYLEQLQLDIRRDVGNVYLTVDKLHFPIHPL
jgi:hypothetical protein